jgi:hypothetical protein
VINDKWAMPCSAVQVKAHMLLLAHLERMGDEVPSGLQQDLKFVITKAPLLLEEMVKIALIPRTQAGTGWMVSKGRCLNCMTLDLRSRWGGPAQ